MGLITSENTAKVYLGIANGRITHKTGADTPPETFTAIEGLLTGINRRMVDIKGQATEFVDFIFKDRGQTYQVSTQFGGGIARSIILCLTSVESFVSKRVKFTPYLSKDGLHTSVMVEVGGQRVAWVTKDIPSVQEVKVGSNVVKDDSERIKFIGSLVEQVCRRLTLVEATPQALAQEGEDLPGVFDDIFVERTEN